MSMTAEEKELEYSLGNILLSNHIQTEARVKMLREIFEAHGYARLAEDECLECHGTKKKRIILPDKAHSPHTIPCPTCQAKAPKLDREAICVGLELCTDLEARIKTVKREERERIETKAMEWVDKEILDLNMNHLYKDMLRQALRGE